MIAPNEKRAFELASQKYKEEAGNTYLESYWTDLKVELIHENTSIEYACKIED